MRNNEKFKKKGFIEHWQLIALYLIIFDLVSVNISYLFSLLLRFDLQFTTIPSEYLKAFCLFMPIYTVFCFVIFGVFRLYKSLWRFAGFSELNRIVAATFVTTVFHYIVSIFKLFNPIIDRLFDTNRNAISIEMALFFTMKCLLR